MNGLLEECGEASRGSVKCVYSCGNEKRRVRCVARRHPTSQITDIISHFFFCCCFICLVFLTLDWPFSSKQQHVGSCSSDPALPRSDLPASGLTSVRAMRQQPRLPTRAPAACSGAVPKVRAGEACSYKSRATSQAHCARGTHWQATRGARCPACRLPARRAALAVAASADVEITVEEDTVRPAAATWPCFLTFDCCFSH